MTKAEQFDRAWKLAFHQDTSLVDKIYHPDYKAIDHRWGIEVTIDSDKVIEFTVAKLTDESLLWSCCSTRSMM